MRIGPAAAPAVPELLKMLDATKDGRVAILWALAAIGPAAKEAIPALRAKLADANPQVALAAAGALQRIAGEGLKPLLAALTDPDQARAKIALSEIGRAGATGTAPEVRHLLEDESLRRDAAIALYRIGGAGEKEAYAIVLDAVRAGDDTSCRLAVLALRERAAPDDAAVTALVTALKTRGIEIQYHAAVALRSYGPVARPALPALRETLAAAGPPLNVAIKDAIVAVR
jgi:HEAT repeat protein